MAITKTSKQDQAFKISAALYKNFCISHDPKPTLLLYNERPLFTTVTVENKYPEWYRNNNIKNLPIFYRVYLKTLNQGFYKLIYVLLKLLNSKINVESL